jgi:tellurite resistance protein
MTQPIVNGNTSFIGDLSYEDHQRLRKVVHATLLQRVGSQFRLNDREADKIIEALGPKTREAMIKTAVDKYGLD